jgi:hypothetical protein
MYTQLHPFAISTLFEHKMSLKAAFVTPESFTNSPWLVLCLFFEGAPDLHAADWMGYTWFVLIGAWKVGFMRPHPGRKNKDAPRMGHPIFIGTAADAF